jgi:hypothetical protein
VTTAVQHAIQRYVVGGLFLAGGIALIVRRAALAVALAKRLPRDRLFASTNTEAAPGDVLYWRLRILTTGIFAVCLCTFMIVLTLLNPQGFR